MSLYSVENITEHEQHLREVLTAFRKSHLYANSSKCALAIPKEGHFLRARHLPS